MKKRNCEDTVSKKLDKVSMKGIDEKGKEKNKTSEISAKKSLIVSKNVQTISDARRVSDLNNKLLIDLIADSNMSTMPVHYPDSHMDTGDKSGKNRNDIAANTNKHNNGKNLRRRFKNDMDDELLDDEGVIDDCDDRIRSMDEINNDENKNDDDDYADELFDNIKDQGNVPSDPPIIIPALIIPEGDTDVRNNIDDSHENYNIHKKDYSNRSDSTDDSNEHNVYTPLLLRSPESCRVSDASVKRFNMLSSFLPQKNLKNGIEKNNSNIHYDDTSECGENSLFNGSNKDKTNIRDDKTNKSPLRQFHFPVVPNSPAPLNSKVTKPQLFFNFFLSSYLQFIHSE
jgi:hypothetical protein